MTNRSILFTKKDTAEFVDEAMPEPRPGQVRIRLVRSCISSGTERAKLVGVPDGGVGIFDAGDATTWPRRSGYSCSGVVDKVGEGVCGLKVADRVAASWSTHSQFVCVPVQDAYPVPDGVSFEDAAFAHIATFPMAAIRKCRLEVGEGAIVMGQGILGQMAVLLLRAAGAVPVIAADPDAAKRERALWLGADAALDPADEAFAEKAKALCRSEHSVMGGRVAASGPAVGIEVTGVGKALDGVLDAIAPYGRIALLGCTRNSNFTIDYYHKVHGRGVALVGAHTLARRDVESSPGWWTQRDDALVFLRLVELGRIDLSGFVEEVHSPAECAEVYSRLANGGAFPTVQFDWEMSWRE
jgi:threonine dehydrogenase-like Zn-dependent dehydrogenase